MQNLLRNLGKIGRIQIRMLKLILIDLDLVS
jgi:hypothetical protein